MTRSIPRSRLPPLNAIAAFDAAARHGSFLLAADELSITPSAVSHRIRTLEAALGLRLFERGHRSIALTPEGERYWTKVRAALSALEEADAVTRPTERRIIRVQAHSGIGATWLSEQLVRYQELHPEVDFLLSAAYSRGDLRGSAVHVAIHYGENTWGGLVRRPLFAESIFPVASPALVERLNLRAPADLLRATLLRHSQLRWSKWFRATGIELPEPTIGPQFDDMLAMLEAAARGAGAALVVGTVFERSRFVEALRAPFDLRVPDDTYYLVLSEVGWSHPFIREFASWLIRRARGDTAFEPI